MSDGDSFYQPIELGSLTGFTFRAGKVGASTLGVRDGWDIYRFTLTQSGSFTASLTGLTGIGQNTDLEIYDSRGNLGFIDGSYNAPTGGFDNPNERINLYLNAGTYYAAVYAQYSDNPLGSNYTLTLEPPPPPIPPHKPTPTPTPLPPILPILDGFTYERRWYNFLTYPREVADVNGDGRADIVGFGQDAVHVALGNPNGTFNSSILSFPTNGFTINRGGWTDFNAFPRQIADVNGDGRADIVAFGWVDVYVALANPDGTFTDSVISQPTHGFTRERGGWRNFDDFPRELADVNGDGRADIIGFGEAAVFVALANPDGTFGDSIVSLPTDGFTRQRGGWVNNFVYPRRVADVNGDGRADVVGFGASDVFVALANPDGTFTDSVVSQPTHGFTRERGGWIDISSHPRELADVNGDGRADIIGFGEAAIFVALGNADGTFRDSIVSLPTDGFTRQRGGWSSFYQYPRQVADVNGDGRADIIGFGGGAVYVALANADGTFGNSIISFAESNSRAKLSNLGTNVANRIIGTADHDILIGLGGNDRLSGVVGNDSLDGGEGNDRLNGGLGNDSLNGGVGYNLLTGGRGRDTFYLNRGAGHDRIADYRNNQDKLRLPVGVNLRRINVVEQVNSILIQVSGDVLAVLHGVDASQIRRNDFI